VRRRRRCCYCRCRVCVSWSWSCRQESRGDMVGRQVPRTSCAGIDGGEVAELVLIVIVQTSTRSFGIGTVPPASWSGHQSTPCSLRSPVAAHDYYSLELGGSTLSPLQLPPYQIYTSSTIRHCNCNCVRYSRPLLPTSSFRPRSTTTPARKPSSMAVYRPT
jgi:hypothetical protein